MTGRGQANALSRATAVLGALFFATALLMSIISSGAAAAFDPRQGIGPGRTDTPIPISPGKNLDHSSSWEAVHARSMPRPRRPLLPLPRRPPSLETS